MPIGDPLRAAGRREVNTRAKVAVAALLLACGQSLEGARMQVVTFDDDGVRTVTTGIDSQWYSIVAVADVDLDGDDELIVLGGSVAAMQPDGQATPILEHGDERALWSLRPGGGTADLFTWTSYGGGSSITHAACDLGESPTCAVSGTIEVDDRVDSMTAGDFDEDGGIDIVTSADDIVSLRISTGDDWRHPVWSEGTKLLVTSGWREENTVASGDLDGDGHLDVVAAAGAYGVRLFFGTGDGTFGQIRPSLDAHIDEVQLADFDDDGVAEIVIASDSGPWVVRRLRGREFDGGMGIAPPGVVDASELETIPGDFDGDGRDELFILDENGSAWLVELDAGSRDWITTPVEQDSANYWAPRFAADLDGDGRDAVASVLMKELPVECAIGGAAARR